jgi:hypothetical protein
LPFLSNHDESDEAASDSYVSPHLHTCLLPLFHYHDHRSLRLVGVVDVGRSDDDDNRHDQYHQDDLGMVNGVVVFLVVVVVVVVVSVAVKLVRVLVPGKEMKGEG